MYLATAAFGCLLIIIGCLMPHKSENAEQSITQKTENNMSDVPSSPDTFGLELLEKQAELADRRIEILSDKISELEDKLEMCINNISNNSYAYTEQPDNNSIIENNLPTSDEEGHEYEKEDINSIIYSMYDKGASLDEISSALRIGRGELQLRLGLRKSQM